MNLGNLFSLRLMSMVEVFGFFKWHMDAVSLASGRLKFLGGSIK